MGAQNERSEAQRSSLILSKFSLTVRLLFRRKSFLRSSSFFGAAPPSSPALPFYFLFLLFISFNKGVLLTGSLRSPAAPVSTLLRTQSLRSFVLVKFYSSWEGRAKALPDGRKIISGHTKSFSEKAERIFVLICQIFSESKIIIQILTPIPFSFVMSQDYSFQVIFPHIIFDFWKGKVCKGHLIGLTSAEEFP